MCMQLQYAQLTLADPESCIQRHMQWFIIPLVNRQKTLNNLIHCISNCP